jgi:ribosomal-protein-alanine N-acetyltransferase
MKYKTNKNSRLLHIVRYNKRRYKMLIHKGTNTIETERLVLRKFKIEDAEGMYKNWATDKEVTKFLTWKIHESVEFTKNLLNNWIDAYKNEGTYNWIIEIKEEKEVVGNISTVKVNESNLSCEIGYCISSKYWNKGITTEAMRAVINYLFREVGFNRVVALYDTNNPASGKVMAKSNMKYEGTFRQAGVRGNKEFYDLAQYAIIKEDYLAFEYF